MISLNIGIYGNLLLGLWFAWLPLNLYALAIALISTCTLYFLDAISIHLIWNGMARNLRHFTIKYVFMRMSKLFSIKSNQRIWRSMNYINSGMKLIKIRKSYHNTINCVGMPTNSAIWHWFSATRAHQSRMSSPNFGIVSANQRSIVNHFRHVYFSFIESKVSYANEMVNIELSSIAASTRCLSINNFVSSNIHATNQCGFLVNIEFMHYVVILWISSRFGRCIGLVIEVESFYACL